MSSGITEARAFAPASVGNIGVGFDLLGHSMGTRVVAELVLALPGQVAAAAYVAGNPIPSARELRGRERFRSPKLRQ